MCVCVCVGGGGGVLIDGTAWQHIERQCIINVDDPWNQITKPWIILWKEYNSHMNPKIFIRLYYFFPVTSTTGWLCWWLNLICNFFLYNFKKKKKTTTIAKKKKLHFICCLRWFFFSYNNYNILYFLKDLIFILDSITYPRLLFRMWKWILQSYLYRPMWIL